jgi:hypothetical protein
VPPATIYIAGPVAKIESVCRKFCERGMCVTVTPTTYIYTGGSEGGVGGDDELDRRALHGRPGVR